MKPGFWKPKETTIVSHLDRNTHLQKEHTFEYQIVKAKFKKKIRQMGRSVIFTFLVASQIHVADWHWKEKTGLNGGKWFALIDKTIPIF